MVTHIPKSPNEADIGYRVTGVWYEGKLTESDISLTKQKRGDANRLGFAFQLCYMRYPGILSGVHETLDAYLLKFIAKTA